MKLFKKLLICGASLIMAASLSAGNLHVNASHAHRYRLLVTEPTSDDVTEKRVTFYSNSSSSTMYKLGVKLAKSYDFDDDDILIPKIANSRSFEKGYRSVHHDQEHFYSFNAARSYVKYHHNRNFKRGFDQGDSLDGRESKSQERYIIKHSKNAAFDRGVIAGNLFLMTDPVKGVQNKVNHAINNNGNFRANRTQLRKMVIGLAKGFIRRR